MIARGRLVVVAVAGIATASAVNAAIRRPVTIASATDARVPPSPIAWSPMAPGAARATVTSDSAVAVQLFRFDLQRFSAEVVVGDGVPPRRQTASDLVQQRRAVAAVNGGFFDEHLAPLGLRIVAMKTRVPLRPKADWGVLVLSASQAHIVHTREFQPRPDITGAIQVGPRIVVDGAPLKLRPQSARRTVVALDRDGRMLTLVLVAEAIEANELGALLAGLGFDAAMMLDGGPSTQFAVDLNTTRVDIPGGYPVPDLLIIVPGPAPARARPTPVRTTKPSLPLTD